MKGFGRFSWLNSMQLLNWICAQTSQIWNAWLLRLVAAEFTLNSQSLRNIGYNHSSKLNPMLGMEGKYSAYFF